MSEKCGVCYRSHPDDVSCFAYPPTVPRVASGLSDLRYGMWIAWFDNDEWNVAKVENRRQVQFMALEVPIVILSDPESEPVTVSREALQELDDAEAVAHAVRAAVTWGPHVQRVMTAARALVDEVRGADA